jgi:hypothetical protein
VGSEDKNKPHKTSPAQRSPSQGAVIDLFVEARKQQTTTLQFKKDENANRSTGLN